MGSLRINIWNVIIKSNDNLFILFGDDFLFDLVKDNAEELGLWQSENHWYVWLHHEYYLDWQQPLFVHIIKELIVDIEKNDEQVVKLSVVENRHSQHVSHNYESHGLFADRRSAVLHKCEAECNYGHKKSQEDYKNTNPRANYSIMKRSIHQRYYK